MAIKIHFVGKKEKNLMLMYVCRKKEFKLVASSTAIVKLHEKK